MTDRQLLKRFFSGDRIALAKLISRAENNSEGSDSLLDEIYRRTGGAYRIGVTGPPGAGKSTLVDQLVRLFRRENKRVGVIAVDPTSPFTGGALLGDRIRMQSSQEDPEVFIRSMATRGSLGGLAHATQEVADVFDAFGKEVIFLETVGVGQSELDVVEAADTVLVVLVPESGDSIQAMKAGLMEIGDIFVLNKSDHENARRAFVELQSILSLNPPRAGWHPPLLQTVASENKGVDAVMEQIRKHRAFLEESGRLEEKRRRRVRDRLRRRLQATVMERFWERSREKRFEELVGRILRGERTYREALEELLAE